MPRDAKQLREQSKLRHYTCLLMIALTANLYGCSSARPYSHPEFVRRMDTIKSIAVLPPNVAVYEARSVWGPSEGLMREKTKAARAHLEEAIAMTFRRSEKFTAKYFLPAQDSLQDEEFNSLRPNKLELDSCLPTPILALREAVDANALLITRAIELNWRDDPERSRDLSRLAIGALLFPASATLATSLFLVASVVSTRFRQAMVGGGLTALQICLVDTRTGDDLWSYLQEFTGADALQDTELARTAVDEALKNFQASFVK